MFDAVRRANAIVDTIGLTPEELGIPLRHAETIVGSGFVGERSTRSFSTRRLHLQSSHRGTASPFQLSQYRVHRAIERRGRPINEDRLDVEIALLLCHW
jgi:hypothetical protein